MGSRIDPTKLAAVLSAITRAAGEGSACPTNAEICGIVGADSVSAGVRYVAELEKRGLIVVERFGTGREVLVCSTGTKTAFHGARNHHWRQCGAKNPGAYTGRRREPSVIDRIDQRSLPPVVDRDPCPRCGVRRDIGCAHGRAPLSMGAFA